MKINLLLWLAFVSSWVCIAQKEYNQVLVEQSRNAHEYEMTHDPKTGKVPKERLYERMQTLMQEEEGSRIAKMNGVGTIDKWIEIGPTNIGGRVRAVTILSDKKQAFAGGVTGGLWYTTDISATTPYWRRVNDYLANLNVTTIAIDPINSNVMYFGTGEGWRNPYINSSVFDNAAFSRGAGIWKSTDAGKTWVSLVKTFDPSQSTYANDFSYVQKIVVKKVNATTTNIYAATLKGLYRSTDGGANWFKVLDANNGAAVNSVADIEIASNGTLFVSMGVREQDGVYRSTTGDLADWTLISTPNGNSFCGCGYNRLELCSVPNNPNIFYLLASLSDGTIQGLYRSTNVNASVNNIVWTQLCNKYAFSADSTFDDADYANTLIIDPLTPAGVALNQIKVFVGFMNLFRSTNGGTTFQQLSHWQAGGTLPYLHADQHSFTFAPGTNSPLYISNDGGIFASTNPYAASPTFKNISTNLNITQFYSGAFPEDIHTYIGGAQDNGVLAMTESGLTQANTFHLGADGGYCHYDEISTHSIISNNGALKAYNGTSPTDLMALASAVGSNTGRWAFLPQSDLDRANDILYLAGDTSEIVRFSNVFSATPTAEKFSFTTTMKGKRASYIKVSPNDPNQVYIGTTEGRIIRICNAMSSTPCSEQLTSGVTNGYVSSIDIKKNGGSTDNEAVFTYSNYGISSSIMYTSNINPTSPTFNNIESTGLGDMPIRCALFAPTNGQNIKLLIGTELGIFTTDAINSISTVWTKYPTSRGMPNVRVNMLKMRDDKMILAATFGRGLIRSDMFCSDKIEFSVNNPNPYKFCGVALTFTDNSTGFAPANYDTFWETRLGSTVTVYNTNSSTFNLQLPDCWYLNPIMDMNVYVKKIYKTTGNVVSRYGKPLYSMITPSNTAPSGLNCVANCGLPPTNRQAYFKDVIIYPNPSENVFEIKANKSITTIEIHDTNGRLVYKRGSENSIDLNDYPTGIYYCRITFEDGTFSIEKLLKI